MINRDYPNKEGDLKMKKFMNWMEKNLSPVAEKIGSNKILKSISAGFSMTMPIIIIGAIFCLLSSLQIQVYQDFLTSTGLSALFVIPGKFTTDILAVYVSFAVAYSYVKNEGLTAYTSITGLLSILAFFILTPLRVIEGVSYISFDYLGAKGLFTALIVGLLVGAIYTFIIKKDWVIKMPDGVPPIVSKSFTALIPGFIITLVFIIINGLFDGLVGTTFSEWLYSIIATPLASLSGSLPTFLLLLFICSLFWFFGLHGGQITIPISIILFMTAGAENQAAYAAGEAMPNILTIALLFYLSLGGVGNTIGLAIDMALFSKSNQFKTLGKISILPSLCSINEPIMFGMPIILNPVMAIPFFLVPQITAIITYFAMSSGLVSLTRIVMGATGTPLLLDGWLICGLSGVVLEVILIALTALIYYPFFKIQDNMACKNELQVEDKI